MTLERISDLLVLLALCGIAWTGFPTDWRRWRYAALSLALFGLAALHAYVHLAR